MSTLQFYIGRYLKGSGRKIEHGLDSRGNDSVDHRLCRVCRHRDHRDSNLRLPHDLAKVPDVIDGNAGTRALPDLLAHRIEERHDLEALVAEAGIVRQRQPQISCPHYRDRHVGIETKYLTKMTA